MAPQSAREAGQSALAVCPGGKGLCFGEHTAGSAPGSVPEPGGPGIKGGLCPPAVGVKNCTDVYCFGFADKLV